MTLDWGLDWIELNHVKLDEKKFKRNKNKK